jgi:predicted membrane protein
MSKMGSGMFWGILLILVGLSLIIRILFHINIPIFKILIALFFIYLGLKILLGHSFSPFRKVKEDYSTFFSETIFQKVENNKEYNVIFGKAIIDLQHFQPDTASEINIEVNVIFGSAEIIVPKSLNVSVEADAVFGKAVMPNGNSASFGDVKYSTDSISQPPTLRVNSDVIFGSLLVRQY